MKSLDKSSNAGGKSREIVRSNKRSGSRILQDRCQGGRRERRVLTKSSVKETSSLTREENKDRIGRLSISGGQHVRDASLEKVRGDGMVGKFPGSKRESKSNSSK
jgi:hypothetical protein